MTTRTTNSTVTFARPFRLSGLDEALPAGTYNVETDEELLEGVSFPVYRRTLSVIHLRSTPNHPGLTRVLPIDHVELETALERDRRAEMMSKRAGKRQAQPRQDDQDRDARDRAEGEGMVRQPI